MSGVNETKTNLTGSVVILILCMYSQHAREGNFPVQLCYDDQRQKFESCSIVLAITNIHLCTNICFVLSRVFFVINV